MSYITDEERNRFESSYDPTNPHFQTSWNNRPKTGIPEGSRLNDPAFHMGYADSMRAEDPTPNTDHMRTHQISSGYDDGMDMMTRMDNVLNDPAIPNGVKTALRQNDPAYVQTYLNALYQGTSIYGAAGGESQNNISADAMANLQNLSSNLTQRDNPYPTRGEMLMDLADAATWVVPAGLAGKVAYKVGKHGVKHVVKQVADSDVYKGVVEPYLRQIATGGVLGGAFAANDVQSGFKDLRSMANTLLDGTSIGIYYLGDKMQEYGPDSTKMVSDWFHERPHLKDWDD